MYAWHQEIKRIKVTFMYTSGVKIFTLSKCLSKSATMLSIAFVLILGSTNVRALEAELEASGRYKLDITVSDAWARATFALAKTGAAYFSISNNANHDITLVSAHVNEDIAMMTELHHTLMEDGMMRMQELAQGALIGPKQTLSFAPGGKHIMLMGLTGPLIAGESLEITLVFSNGTQIIHDFPIVDKR